MRSNTQALALMKQANKSVAARAIFVGDTKQLDGVAAGTPIDSLQTSGMPTAVMSDIVRQRSEQLKSAVSASITGSIQQAFERLGNSVKSGRPEYVQAAADLYLNRLVSERTETGILTLSNKAHQEINLAVRAGL